MWAEGRMAYRTPSSRTHSKSSTLTMYLLISFRKSTPPQNRQLNISIRNAKQ